jgi:membrane-bound metal-dependent hydrolase YbcI (DUF457 family)
MQGIHYINRQTGALEQEKVPAEGWLRWLYHNPLGKLALHSVVKRRFLSSWYGRLMDRPASRRRIPDFIADLQIDLAEVRRPLAEFATFNDFFIRQLKPEARPIDDDPAALVSPADGKVLAFPGIRGLDSFFVKGSRFSLETLLQNAALARKYAGGTLLIFRLAPVDYHRFHFPADGRISPATPIPGSLLLRLPLRGQKPDPDLLAKQTGIQHAKHGACRRSSPLRSGRHPGRLDCAKLPTGQQCAERDGKRLVRLRRFDRDHALRAGHRAGRCGYSAKYNERIRDNHKNGGAAGRNYSSVAAAAQSFPGAVATAQRIFYTAGKDHIRPSGVGLLHTNALFWCRTSKLRSCLIRVKDRCGSPDRFLSGKEDAEMAQAGIHGIVGVGVRKWLPKREWLMLGILLGNLLPDADNLVVAAATVAGWSTAGLHRTFTHSLFTVAAIIALFYAAARITRRARWGNLGLGLGIGIVMHILLDLLIWFNGVEILWPLPSWVNLWAGVSPPGWWSQLMLPVEFLFFAAFFIMLGQMARRQGSDADFLPRLRVWTAVQAALFVVFLVLLYTMESGFMTPYGAVYLLSLGLTCSVIIRMRQTIEI